MTQKAHTAMTPAIVRGLNWVAAQRAPVGWFPIDAPSHTPRKRLEERGFIERTPSRPFEVIPYQITDAGRTALLASLPPCLSGCCTQELDVDA